MHQMRQNNDVHGESRKKTECTRSCCGLQCTMSRSKEHLMSPNNELPVERVTSRDISQRETSMHAG